MNATTAAKFAAFAAFGMTRPRNEPNGGFKDANRERKVRAPHVWHQGERERHRRMRQLSRRGVA